MTEDTPAYEISSSSDIHWRYYLSLEKEIAELSDYIEFDQANFGVYSIKLTRLLLTLGAEVASVLKALAEQIRPGVGSAENIRDFRVAVMSKWEGIAKERIFCSLLGSSLIPYESWLDEKQPTWWGEHTDLKHNRTDHFRQGNLSNVLHAAAALFLANVYLNHEIQFKHRAREVDLKDSFSYLRCPLKLFYFENPWRLGLDLDC